MSSLQAVSQHVEDTWDGPMDFDFDPISGGDVEPSRLLLKPVEKAVRRRTRKRQPVPLDKCGSER